MKLEDYCVFLDAGHGAYGPDGKYVTAPSKQFKHSKGEFHEDGWFYEGVWNRTLTNRVAAKLDELGINRIIVSHEWVDVPLQYRVDKANWYHKNFRKGLFVSNHANASSAHNARGFEVYTSRGRTSSDAVASFHFENVRDLLGDKIRLRPDHSDSDHDREANFFVLAKTAMTAILVEHLFFDNFDDATLLMDAEVVELFAEAQVRTIIQHINSL